MAFFAMDVAIATRDMRTAPLKTSQTRCHQVELINAWVKVPADNTEQGIYLISTLHITNRKSIIGISSYSKK
jgi:hypothetical protein